MSVERSGDVEVVAATLVVKEGGEILLIKSPKWGDKFLIPGGHVEKGETILEAAKREGEEELGIELAPKYCVNIMELINSPLFNRKAHLVSFHVVCEAVTNEIKLNNELSEFLWIAPGRHDSVLLAEGLEHTFENYLNGTKININSLRY